MEDKEEKDIYATSIIEWQNNEKKFYQKIIILLIILMAAQAIYHDHKWAEFDTVVVDSDEGNASYIGNDGDVNNYGKGSSTQKETAERQQEAETN